MVSNGIVSYHIISYQVLFSNYINGSSVHESFGQINGKILKSTRWLDVYSKWAAKLNCTALTNIGPTKCTKPSQLCNLIAHNNMMNGLQPQSLLCFRAEVIILKQNISGPHPFCHGCLQPFSPRCLSLLVCKMSSSPPPLFVPVISAATHGWVHGFVEVNRLGGWLGEGRPQKVSEVVFGSAGWSSAAICLLVSLNIRSFLFLDPVFILVNARYLNFIWTTT